MGIFVGGCLFDSALTIWCSSLLEDARSILSRFQTLCLPVFYKSFKIVSFVFFHFLSA